MKKYQTILVLLSLFFLMVEIWEPSTNFVRAAIHDPSASAFTQTTPDGVLEGTGSTFLNASSKTNRATTFDDDEGISHCSDGFFIFELIPIQNVLSFDASRPTLRLDGYSQVPTLPPIRA
jgi:hypothetical protein